MAGYRRGAHTVFEIPLHLVWITKYRRPALQGEVATRVRDLIRDICGQHEVAIMKGPVSKDHPRRQAFLVPFLPVILKSPTRSFFFVSTEMTGSPCFRNRFAVRLIQRNSRSRSAWDSPSLSFLSAFVHHLFQRSGDVRIMRLDRLSSSSGPSYPSFFRDQLAPAMKLGEFPSEWLAYHPPDTTPPRSLKRRRAERRIREL
jgi:hypothetical protein